MALLVHVRHETKLSLLIFIIESSEFAYLSLHHIFHTCTIYTWEISDIFEQSNVNCNLWACIRKLFKIFLTNCDSSDYSELVSSGTVDHLHVGVSVFSKFWKKSNCNAHVIYLLKDFEIILIFNVKYLVDYKTLI